MNIFYLDESPKEAAMAHVDSHVVKMPLEYAQLLCTAHRVIDGSAIGYEATHVNHPSAVWARQSRENYRWLFRLYAAVSEEYRFRYARSHKSWVELNEFLMFPPDNIDRERAFAPPTPAMPAQYLQFKRVPTSGKQLEFNVLESYRAYYREGKAHLHRWSRRERPEWCKDY